MNANEFAAAESKRMAKILADRRAKYAARGREWLKAEAAKIQVSLNTQRASRTNYEGGGLVACLEGRLEDLRAAWVLAGVLS